MKFFDNTRYDAKTVKILDIELKMLVWLGRSALVLCPLLALLGFLDLLEVGSNYEAKQNLTNGLCGYVLAWYLLWAVKKTRLYVARKAAAYPE